MKSKRNKKINSNKKTLKGGKFIGEGSYGCVVSPAIPCNKSKKNLFNTIKLQKSVSKIIIAPDDDIKEEILISEKLKKLDKTQNYFITFEDKCYIKKVPSERSNTAGVEFHDNSHDTYSIIKNKNSNYNKKYDKKICPIDLSLNPINMIMPFGGYNLLNILNNNKNPNIILTREMLVINFRKCFKHLLFGLKLMHDNRIVNRDIKNENILVNYSKNEKSKLELHTKQSNNGKINIRFIDFGLSNILTPDHCRKMSNIGIHGTSGLISPDLIIVECVNSNISFDEIKKIIKSDVKNVLHSFKNPKININIDKIIIELYLKIRSEYKNRDILKTFFGSDTNIYNGYLQKGDIYSLGITIYEFYTIYKQYFINTKINNKELININLVNLLENMINVDPYKRYNVIQCLKHSYFTNT